MAIPNLTSIRQQLSGTVGPSPWYWKTFPALHSAAGQRLFWTHHGSEGPVGYVVSLALEREADHPRLALNTYARPFIVSPHCLGVWCPEGRSIRLTVFDPDKLQPFDLAEIAGWFKQSSDRIYSKTPPIAEFEVLLLLALECTRSTPTGTGCSRELIVPTSYKATSNDDPAFALFVLYLQAGWWRFCRRNGSPPRNIRSANNGFHARPRPGVSSHLRECYGAGTFLLEEDGCRMAEWMDRKS